MSGGSATSYVHGRRLTDEPPSDRRRCPIDAHDFPLLAGTLSTTLFVISYLPMLVKAFRTRDLASYSLGNLVIANVGNGVHSIYVFSLPIGPIWFLHGFYLLSTAVMLVWYRRYVRRRTTRDRARDALGLPA